MCGLYIYVHRGYKPTCSWGHHLVYRKVAVVEPVAQHDVLLATI